MLLCDRKLIFSLSKGVASYLPGFSIFERQRAKNLHHSARNARFCYSFWLRNLVYLLQNNLCHRITLLGELGTGGSLGIGLCALLTNTMRYCALDIEKNGNLLLNLELAEEIYELLLKKTPIPDHCEFPQINLVLNTYHFPVDILVKLGYRDFFTKGRLLNLCKDIKRLSENKQGNFIEIAQPWMNKLRDKEAMFDYVFSRAVMEHVSNPEDIYCKIYVLLRQKGLMFHDIEFHSHDITTRWDGHYALPDFLWHIIKGKRRYFLNRYLPSQHLRITSKCKYNLIDRFIVRNEVAGSSYNAEKFEFDDKTIYGMSVLSQKLG